MTANFHCEPTDPPKAADNSVLAAQPGLRTVRVLGRVLGRDTRMGAGQTGRPKSSDDDNPLCPSGRCAHISAAFLWAPIMPTKPRPRRDTEPDRPVGNPPL